MINSEKHLTKLMELSIMPSTFSLLKVEGIRRIRHE
jgi:hypothetical protein